MAYIPRDHNFDSTLALLHEGYPFFSKRCKELGADAFTTRLMMKKVTCAVGEDAAKMFYHPDRFTRKKSMPPTTMMLLQDLGSVQLRDGAAHRQRKQLFMSLMSAENVQSVVNEMTRQWRNRLAAWQKVDEITLQDEVREILCRAVCRWAGITLSDKEASERTREFGAMIDGAGTVGPKNWRGLALRHRTERWAQNLIEQVRSGDYTTRDSSALATIAFYSEDNGELLDTKAAAVELLNVLRPTVAVARFITFAALALHENPQCREALENLRIQGQIEEGEHKSSEYTEWFVQEVRRFYPFFPCVGGRVREEFTWKGQRFERGEWVLLDLYGTNHDARIWDKPDTFKPERFADWNGSAFNFVPQGAGHFRDGHRCPGERLTIELVKAAVQMLVHEMHYDVPEQDLKVDLTQMPAIPKSGFVLRNVRRAQTH